MEDVREQVEGRCGEREHIVREGDSGGGCGDAGRGLEDWGLRHRQVREGHAGGGGCHADESDERGGGPAESDGGGGDSAEFAEERGLRERGTGQGRCDIQEREQLENGD